MTFKTYYKIHSIEIFDMNIVQFSLLFVTIFTFLYNEFTDIFLIRCIDTKYYRISTLIIYRENKVL